VAADAGYADVELRVEPAGGDDYAAALDYTPPGGAAEVHLPGPPPRVRLDREALLALRGDPVAYGAGLSAMLFADGRLREGLARFAAEWATRFFRRFLAGEPLGQALLGLRREFYEGHRNLLGLLYALYCDGDTQVVPGLATRPSP
jgi:hypothetical protein